MKYAIFSDVHGTIDAFKHFLADISQYSIDGVIFCGDIMGYYYHSDEIISLMKSVPHLVIVRGNHDFNYLCSMHDKALLNECINNFGNSYNSKISDENLQYLSQLEDEQAISINGMHVGVFHGAPFNQLNGRIYPNTTISTEEEESINMYDILFLGHTHYKMIKQIGDTYIINPGSLGQPRDGKGFGYCIFDFDQMICEYHNIQINFNSIMKEIDNNETSIKNINYLKSVLERNKESML